MVTKIASKVAAKGKERAALYKFKNPLQINTDIQKDQQTKNRGVLNTPVNFLSGECL